MLQVSGRENIKPTFQNPIRWLMFSNEMCSKTGLTIRWTSFGHNCRLPQSTPANAGPHGCWVCVCWGREVLGSTKLARHGTQHSPWKVMTHSNTYYRLWETLQCRKLVTAQPMTSPFHSAWEAQGEPVLCRAVWRCGMSCGMKLALTAHWNWVPISTRSSHFAT